MEYVVTAIFTIIIPIIVLLIVLQLVKAVFSIDKSLRRILEVLESRD